MWTGRPRGRPVLRFELLIPLAAHVGTPGHLVADTAALQVDITEYRSVQAVRLPVNSTVRIDPLTLALANDDAGHP